RVDLNWMVQFLPYNPLIVEVGAYEGEETLRAAKIWPKSRGIFAFEPHPAVFERLRDRVGIEGLSSVTLYRAAVCSYNGTATLHIPRDITREKESSLLAPLPGEQDSKIYVPCVTLDAWAMENEIRGVDLLRVEAEGLELPILQNATEMLKSVK